MNDEAGPQERLEPAEQRVRDLLVSLEGEGAQSDRSLTRRVLSTARWQYAVRGTLRVAGLIGAAVLDGLGLVIGAGRSGRGTG